MAPTLGLVLGLASSIALADHPNYGHRHHGHGGHQGPRAVLEIDNDFDGEALIYVDGQPYGMVDGRDETHLRVRPGSHRVEIRRPDTGFVLASQYVRIRPHSEVRVQVVPPPASLTVRNDGIVPLRVGPGRHGSWLLPGDVTQITVPAGRVPLTATIADPRGDFLVFDRRVWVEPGARNVEVLRPTPPRLALINHEHRPMRVMIDGVMTDIVLRPGQSRDVFLRPGPARVSFVDFRGRTFEVQELALRPGRDAHLAVGSRGRYAMAEPRGGHGHGHRHGHHDWDDDSSSDDRYPRAPRTVRRRQLR